MTDQEFAEFYTGFEDDMLRTLDAKGHDYTRGAEIGESDRLANFKTVAGMLGLTPLQVWAVYYLKHVFAILTYIKTGKVQSEGMRGRFLDAANYAVLGAAIHKEKLDQEG